MSVYVRYCRVSTSGQGRSGLGLEAQVRDIDIFLNTYADSPEVIGEFTDIDSGAENDRTELTKAIALCKETGATLLVAKLDRLSRRVSFIASLMEDKRLNFRVASMPYADKFQLHIYAALAEQERDFISKRTIAALASAKDRGVQLGGLRDVTKRRNDEKVRLANERAEKLRDVIVPLRATLNLKETAAALNSAGIGTTQGCKWTPMQVSRVMNRLETANAGREIHEKGVNTKAETDVEPCREIRP